MEIRHEGQKIWFDKIPEGLVERGPEPIWPQAYVTVHAKKGKLHFISAKRLYECLSLKEIHGRIGEKGRQVKREGGRSSSAEKVFVEIEKNMFFGQVTINGASH
jgi:hypothetical protein